MVADRNEIVFQDLDDRINYFIICHMMLRRRAPVSGGSVSERTSSALKIRSLLRTMRSLSCSGPALASLGNTFFN